MVARAGQGQALPLQFDTKRWPYPDADSSNWPPHAALLWRLDRAWSARPSSRGLSGAIFFLKVLLPAIHILTVSFCGPGDRQWETTKRGRSRSKLPKTRLSPGWWLMRTRTCRQRWTGHAVCSPLVSSHALLTGIASQMNMGLEVASVARSPRLRITILVRSTSLSLVAKWCRRELAMLIDE